MDACNVLDIHEMTGPDDPRWPAWKALYEECFPPHERMSEAYFVGMLEARSAGAPEADGKHMLAAGGAETGDPVAAIAYYEEEAGAGLAFLWYLAVRPDFRSKGLGSALYRELVARAAASGARALVFEVEMPERAGRESAEAGAYAARRTGWYEARGALLLEGVDYVQEVDTGVPPTPMRLMFHPLAPRDMPLDPQQAFDLAKQLFGDNLTQRGPLRFAASPA